MEGVQALSVAEVNLMLRQLETNADRRVNNTDIYIKTRDYCNLFARFKDANSVTQVNQISTELTQRDLGITEFERAQLGAHFPPLLLGLSLSRFRFFIFLRD